MRKTLAVLGLLLAVAFVAAEARADALPAPSGLAPSDGIDVAGPQPELSWTPVPGAQSYEVWTAFGVEGTLPRTINVAAPRAGWVFDTPVADGTLVRWRVRAIGQEAGEWSAEASFWVGRDVTPPEPPSELRAAPHDGGVRLTWRGSPSPDLGGYRLYVRPEGGTYGNFSPIGPVLSTRVEGLAPEATWDFMLTAVDTHGNESVGAVATLAPGARVILRGQPYATIQDAVDAAQPGDTVELGAWTFYEGVILRPGVSLRGAGPGDTVIDASGFPAAVTLEASDASEPSLSTLSMMTLRSGAAGVWGGVASVRLENMVICRVNGPGVRLDAGRLEAARVTVARCQADGIDTGADGFVIDAIVFGCGGAGVSGRGGELTVSWSDLYLNLLGNVAGAVSGEGLMSVAAVFENEFADDYRVSAGDPTVDAGAPDSPFQLEPSPNGGRVNLGAFGNTPFAAASLPAAAGSEVVTSAGGSGSASNRKYCIVATAAHGSADASTVSQLRAFRDRVLRSSAVGQDAVAFYERSAAPIARVTAGSEVLRAVLRSVLR